MRETGGDAREIPREILRGRSAGNEGVQGGSRTIHRDGECVDRSAVVLASKYDVLAGDCFNVLL